MKSAPAVPGNTPWERLDNAVRAVFRVPKDDVLKEEARLKRFRAKRRAAKKAATESQHGHAHSPSKKRADESGEVKKHQARVVR